MDSGLSGQTYAWMYSSAPRSALDGGSAPDIRELTTANAPGSAFVDTAVPSHVSQC